MADGLCVWALTKKAKPRERGSTLLEFAIIAPILMLLLFGIIEFGLAAYRLQGIHAASRDAARVGSLPGITQPQIRARALASLEGTLLDTPPTITVEPDEAVPCANADEIVVTIEAVSPLAIPFFDGGALDLTSRAEFACE